MHNEAMPVQKANTKRRDKAKHSDKTKRNTKRSDKTKRNTTSKTTVRKYVWEKGGNDAREKQKVNYVNQKGTEQIIIIINNNNYDELW